MGCGTSRAARGDRVSRRPSQASGGAVKALSPSSSKSAPSEGRSKASLTSSHSRSRGGENDSKAPGGAEPHGGRGDEGGAGLHSLQLVAATRPRAGSESSRAETPVLTRSEYPEWTGERVRRMSSLSITGTPYNTNHFMPEVPAVKELADKLWPTLAVKQAHFVGSMEGVTLVSSATGTNKVGVNSFEVAYVIVEVSPGDSLGTGHGTVVSRRSGSYSEGTALSGTGGIGTGGGAEGSSAGDSKKAKSKSVDERSPGLQMAPWAPSATSEVIAWLHKPSSLIRIEVLPRLREVVGAMEVDGEVEVDIVVTMPDQVKYIANLRVRVTSRGSEGMLAVEDLSVELSSTKSGGRVLLRGDLYWRVEPSELETRTTSVLLTNEPAPAMQGLASLKVDSMDFVSTHVHVFKFADHVSLAPRFQLSDGSYIQATLILPSLGKLRLESNSMSNKLKLVIMWIRETGTSFKMRMFDPVAHPSTKSNIAVSSKVSERTSKFSLALKGVIEDAFGSHKIVLKFEQQS
ncbi:uncharacterized protein AMSG_05969 [Thecamonas trahens ATCC 50062]|uniref:Uncharacterized protein n=1 Tax=Thecamonas trahens ATCC 50062 TaxID=461836 RepID=A0A0L0DBH9_THETB|nr:hypothetical protein AMSG_05969 [Thecamonas trahens ATCC 50062]KNC49704.1 hypothetical protein AMSG_05969 [Thecamonas trahens ATCC 50062]|eukprot:XP_013757497.1 hypothetical protein AMSG_05969 [Thecamonas trahens ATCC 50062]